MSDPNYFEKLKDLFPNQLETAIQQVIDVVLKLDTSSPEEGLQKMCTLLIAYDAACNFNVNHCDAMLQEELLSRFVDISPEYLENFLQCEATNQDFNSILQQFQLMGYKQINANLKANEVLLCQIKDVFPDACDDYVKQCVKDGMDFDEILDKFTTESYVKSINNCADTLLGSYHKQMCEILPKFDCDFLRDELLKLPKLTDEAFYNCIETLLKMKEYPTIADYNKRNVQKERMLKYIFNIKIDLFLKEFSFNLKTFENPSRKHAMMVENVNAVEFENDKRFIITILCYVYPGTNTDMIRFELERHKYDIIACCSSLGKPQKKELERTAIVLPDNSYTNKLLFQELAYVLYRDLIYNYLRIRTSSYEKAYLEAEAANELRTCKACFDEGLLLMPEEVFQCMDGCDFCKQCMIRGCEVAYGNGLLEIDCFNSCGAKFSDSTLEMVMDPLAYYKLIQRKEIKSIRDARIDGFESCPFCEENGTVMNKDDKIFICRNSECGKETCRECQREAHVPLRCNEVEYDKDVQMRTYLENKMTEALVRVCQACNRQIVKDQGCNIMKCPCGRTMCYICRKTGINYSHFGAKGCPQQSDEKELHRNDILRSINTARVHLGLDKDPTKLRNDPTKGF